jgi:serralysin
LIGGSIDLSKVSDPNTLALLYEFRWSPADNPDIPATKISYAFPLTVGDFASTPASFSPATAAQHSAAETAFHLISSYTELGAVELPSSQAVDATIKIGQSTGSSAYQPSSFLNGGDTVLGPNGVVPAAIDNGDGPVPQYFGTDGFNTIMHELGHAVGLKHGHYEIKAADESDQSAGLPFHYNVVLSPQYNDNEYSVMTYASYLGSFINPTNPATTEAQAGSSPQSYMMFDIAALQVMYGANFDKVGTRNTYRWDSNGVETIDNTVAPDTGVSSTKKIFTTIWTQGAAATYDLHNFTQDQVDDLRPGGYLKFSDTQLAELNSASTDPAYNAHGNVYDALLYHGDMRSEIANLTTGNGNDTLIGNDRDNVLSGGAGVDTISTNGGNDIVHGGAGADIITFGSGDSVLQDSWANLNGDVVNNFGSGAIDVFGRLQAANFTRTELQVKVSGAPDDDGHFTSTVTLNGNFNVNIGAFLDSERGTGDALHTTAAFVQYLPTLKEGVTVNTPTINGIASQGFLTGDGSLHFQVDFVSAVSAFTNQLGWYKVGTDGTIKDVHILANDTLDPGMVGTAFDLGTPADGDRIGFFLIQNGFTINGNLADDLRFVLPGNGQAANVDFWQAPVLVSASHGAFSNETIFHSFAGLNPNATTQVLSGLQPNGNTFMIGFEDLPFASGDRDYQDVVLAVHLTKADHIV